MSEVAATQQNRDAFHDGLIDLIKHLKAYPTVNIVSFSRDANNFAVILLTNPLPVDQLAHLRIVLA